MSDTQTVVVTGSKAAFDDDDVVVQIGSENFGGWKEVRITAGIESCPRDFEMTGTESTADGRTIFARPGDPCEVFLGRDRVVTGYINRWRGSIAAGSHSVQISGRGACQDLVDCSADWPGQQIKSSSVLQVARDLANRINAENKKTGADAHDLVVRGAAGPSVGLPGPDRSSQTIPYLVLIYGESTWDLINRMCQHAGLLAFEDADGALVLAEGPPATEGAPLVLDTAGAGFEEGVNIEDASLALSDDRRFSEYRTVYFSFNALQELGDEMNQAASVADKRVKRFRPLILVAEQGQGMSIERITYRGNWEAARRWGQGHRLRITTDTWRDSTGKLYRPFTLARVHIPSLKLENVRWLISEVTYQRGEHGTSCELTLAPVEAFAPLPALPQYAIPAEAVGLSLRGQ